MEGVNQAIKRPRKGRRKQQNHKHLSFKPYENKRVKQQKRGDGKSEPKC